jgi:hypothetical protein
MTTSPLDNALGGALQIRLALQMSLSSLPVVEEWMDIHLDRWLEHVPMPPEMPDGHAVSYLAAVGTDLRRMWWGAWGNPRGLVPKMADYLKLCNIAKSDEQILDQIGNEFEPALVGSWVGVWGGRVVTGWHFWDPHEFARLEPLFGTHEAKFLLKKWATDHKVEMFQRFMQSIGEGAFSEVELPVPGDTQAARLDAASQAFQHFTGGPIPAPVLGVLRAQSLASVAVAVRIQGGAVTKTSVLVEGISLDGARELCAAATTPFDDKLERIINTLSAEGITRGEYGRAGDHAGVDLFVEPTQPARKPAGGEVLTVPSTAN